MKTYTLNNLMEAVSAITHMEGNSGNESILAREKQVVNGEIRAIPYLSGNALRHRMVREYGVLYLIEMLDLKGKLSLDQLNFLMHGGVLYESNPVSTQIISEMYECLPLLRLLGGSLPGQILHGSLICGRGTLVCRENVIALSAEYPLDYGSLLGAESFVSKYQYTRGDIQKTYPELTKGEIEQTGLMIYAGQTIVKGSCFYQKMILKHVSELELGALLLSLQLWQENGGTIGGSAAKGHGKLFLYTDAGGDERDQLIGTYKKYVESTKDSAIAWLEKAFVVREKKKK